MHPDDEREYMDEISGATRDDWLRETYGPTADDAAYEYPEPEPTLWQKIKSRIYWWRYNLRQWWITRHDNDIPF